MTTLEATRYASRSVKNAQDGPGLIVLTPRELRKAIASAYDAGTGAAPAPKRKAILAAFWGAVSKPVDLKDLAHGFNVLFELEGRGYSVWTGVELDDNTSMTYIDFLRWAVVHQVRVQFSAPVETTRGDGS